MPVAPDVRALKRRLDNYFGDNGTTASKHLRGVLWNHFGEFPEVGVVGGLVRDFARAGRSGFRSDIDLVISAPTSDIATIASKLNARQNVFGGYSYREAPWKIDFWALEATWAVKNGYVTASSINEVIKCTFFDWDAAVYNLKTRSIVCSADYLDRMRERKMDINLRPNPSIEGNLIRALRRMLMWKLHAGPKLESFVVNTLSREMFASVSEREAKAYPDRLLGRYTTAKHLLDELQSVGAIRHTEPKQLELGF